MDAKRNAKKPWDNARLEGKVESKYVFATLLAKDMSSFAFLELKPVVLPVASDSAGQLMMLEVDDLKALGDSHMQAWLETCEGHWRANATKKSIKSFPSVTKRVDYQRELTKQTLERYAVLYPTSGTHLAACLIDTQSLPCFDVGQQSIAPSRFFAESTTYILRTDSLNEALYLVGVLNSRYINDEIKKSQPRGTFGPRHIHKRPLDFSIPKYSEKNATHRKIAELTDAMVREAQNVVDSGVKGRKKFRDSLADIDELDALVSDLIRGK